MSGKHVRNESFNGTHPDCAAESPPLDPRHYYELVQVMSYGLYVFELEDRSDDRTLRLIECNEAASRLTGVGRDVVGQLIDDCFSAARDLDLPHQIAEVVRTGQAADLGNVYYDEDGVRAGHYSARAFPLSGDRAGVVFDDVTQDLQEAQQLQRNSLEARLLHSISEMAAQTDVFEEALRRCVRTVCRIYGWVAGHVYVPSAQEPGVLESAHIWHGPDTPQFRAFRDFSFGQRFAAGTDLPGRILASAKPQWMERGGSGGERMSQLESLRVVGVCGFPVIVSGEVAAVLEFLSREPMAIDDRQSEAMRSMGHQLGRIQERKRQQEEQQGLQERLYQAQKIEAISQLAGGVAHDFNNVMTIIRAAADRSMALLPDDHEVRSLLEAISHAAAEATGVTQALMTFSRDIPASLERLDLVPLVGETTRLLRRMMPASIDVQLDCPTKSALWVLGDGGHLRQVLMNLAINAQDAMFNGGRLTIGLNVVSESGSPRRQARLEVRDNGAGIPEPITRRVVEPFFTTKRRGQGTGLGLSIAHGIILDHGGQMDICSEQGRGTTVVVRLPCMEPQQVRATLPAIATKDGQSGLVLLAEDHPQVRGILSSALQTYGYEVLKVADGQAVLDYHQVYGDAIDLLVLDLDLPKLSGLECLRRVRQRGLQAPAVLITGNVTQVEDDVMDERTVLLRKPFQMDDLGHAAQTLLTDVS